MNATSLLCEIIAQGSKISSDFYGDDKDFDLLVQHGFLSEAGVVRTVVCDECDASHSAQVVFEDGAYGYHCPDLGLVPLDPLRVRAFNPDVPALVNRLAEVFECRQRRSSRLYGQTWRIGAAKTPSKPVMLYFHPTLQSEDDARELQSALDREARSDWRLVLTARGTLPVADLTGVRLDDLIEIDPETGCLCGISDPGHLAGVPRKNPGGAPNRYGKLLSELTRQRQATGSTLPRRNAEARALLSEFKEKHPDLTAPSLSTVNNHVTSSRGGE